MPSTNSVETTLNFFDPARPVTTFVTVNGGKLDVDARDVQVEDARGLEDQLGFDQCGFQLLKHVSRATDLRDPDQREGIYRAEVADLVQGITGADKVIAFYMAIRDNNPDVVGEVRRPAPIVHLDFDADTVALYAREQLELEGADVDYWMSQRYAAYNVWRGLVPVREMPLAVCDGRTVESELLHPVRTEMQAGVPTPYRGLVLEYSPSQRWYYYKDMNPDEVMVFKQFDSERGQVHCNPHTAFDDHRPAPAQRRVSLEARAFAFFKKH